VHLREEQKRKLLAERAAMMRFVESILLQSPLSLTIFLRTGPWELAAHYIFIALK
jgi:hypothetical protein